MFDSLIENKKSEGKGDVPHVLSVGIPWDGPSKKPQPEGESTNPDEATANILDKAKNGVVKITKIDTTTESSPELSKIFGAKDGMPTTTTSFDFGSGFYYDKDGDIITNAHVVVPKQGADSSVLTVKDASGKMHPAHIIAIDPSKDLAKIQIDDRRTPDDATPLTIASGDKELKPDEPVWAIGHPRGAENTYISPGTIEGQGPNKNSELRDYLFDHPASASSSGSCTSDAATKFASAESGNPGMNFSYLNSNQYQAKIHVEHGNSGGGVVDGSAEIIGVVAKGNIPTFTGYLVPAKDVRKFLDSPPPFEFSYKPDPLRPGYQMLYKVSGPPDTSPLVPSFYDYLTEKCGK